MKLAKNKYGRVLHFRFNAFRIALTFQFSIRKIKKPKKENKRTQTHKKEIKNKVEVKVQKEQTKKKYLSIVSTNSCKSCMMHWHPLVYRLLEFN